MKKILLISPLDPKKHTNPKLLMGGESTYTQMLLRYAPVEIEFVHYTHALLKKNISYHWTYFWLLWLQKFRILPPGPRALPFVFHSHFDGVYAHAHPTRNTHNHPPLFLSDSSSSIIFQKYYISWPRWRIRLGLLLKQVFYKIFNIVDAEIVAADTQKIFVFSEWARRIKIKGLGLKKIEVMYPGLPIPKDKKILRNQDTQSKIIKILFVGVWFERKGGRMALRIFRKLASKYPHIHLTILGQLPLDITIGKDEHITHHSFVTYGELQKNYQSHDLLVHIPPIVEGYGMAVPEAMSYGMCCVVSDVCVLPEFITHKKTGWIVKAKSESDLEIGLETLITDPKLRKQLGQHARKEFIKKFSVPVFQKQLTQFLR